MNVTDFDIFGFIETYGVTPLKNSAAITSITDLTNGKYRVYTGDTKAFVIETTYNLNTLSNVVISGTTALNGIYQIENIVTNVSFDLVRKFDDGFKNGMAVGIDTSLAATPLWTNRNPTFVHDEEDYLNTYLESYISNMIPFPAIVMPEPLDVKELRYGNRRSYDLKVENAVFGILVKRDPLWIRSDFETHAFTIGRQMGNWLVANLESVTNITTIEYGVELIQSIGIVNVFNSGILKASQQYDAVLSGVAISLNDFIITNAGVNCSD